MKYLIRLILLAALPLFPLFSQELPNAYQPLYGGIEQDILPYLLKGYNLSAWAGMHRTRLRFSYTQVNTPKFWMREGITKERIVASQLALDFFFKDDFKGFWFGPGVGHWQTKVETAKLEKREFPGLVFSLGSGYNWNFYKGFYLSPYIAGHLRISGTRNIEMGTLQYRPSLMYPEISLKLGWKF